MEIQYNITAIIPARSGSVRLQNKNTRNLAGRKLYEYTIDSALESQYIDDIVVTTDITEMMNYSNKVMRRRRPDNLCGADISQEEVIIDAVEWAKSFAVKTDTVILLQPTSPLRTAEDIDCSIEMYYKTNAKTLVSVSEPIESPHDMIDQDNKMLEKTNNKWYYVNGAIYIRDYDDLKNKKTMFARPVIYYIMPKYRSIDIDDEEDLQIAEMIMRGKNG